ncbi:hypothetical protein BJP36_10575 [Moorena producens JHB]|uniref:Glycosyl transferase n=1 Tax=Moorena producens (strain JHB) TaxID=1454205 RepID=A0A1D9FY39_MOOP1|nr:hypothetical protein [Moorena producens]AOY80296.1 hypothetical protein BJP36_10575 [Moorena producens JHB]
MTSNRLIITAASKAYGPSLLALLGSLTLNWPKHPPVLVYDIGLDETTLATLAEQKIPVKKVPPFCSHWRKHFTWKIWCLNDAPAQDVLWMDAGLVVLKPLEEVFDALEHQGYFLVPNYQLLDGEASEAACNGCGVPTEFRLGKLTLAGGLIGVRKQGKVLRVVEEALSVALVEKHIAATEPTHRHGQAIISLLMYKHFGQVVLADGIVYLGWRSPNQTHGQKVWVHRRGMLAEDIAFFASHIRTPGKPYMPKDPAKQKPTRSPRSLAMKFNRFGKPLSPGALAPTTQTERENPIYDGVRD